MYDKRIKIFVILIASLLLVCVLRLAQMQLLSGSYYQARIEELKLQRGLSRQLKTIRGRILDRKGEILAVDEPQFQLHINYELSSVLDERVRRAKLLKAANQHNTNPTLSDVRKELENKLADLQQIIEKCTYFGIHRSVIESRIEEINDQIWNLRQYLAWKRSFPNGDFVKAVPDVNDRLLLTAKVDIAEMYKDYSLLELKTDDDIFTAQLEFTDIDGIQILAKAQRLYPYGSVAAQTIGWVGLATQEQDKKLFTDDKLASYLDGEVCGREDGVEYVCEAILRGRRGEILYDIDRQLIDRTETEFGKDVQLSLDIELQKKIENYLVDCDHNPNCKAPTAIVVIDVATGDILALVSTPVFDLNRARYDYAALLGDPNQPMRNRAINKQYPPGSVVKPLILIAGLESGKITPDESISCPAQKAPEGWPSCWMYNRYQSGHDYKWVNKARNAIKGSCNIYFSRLADRIDPSVLQQWLFKFGYGHKLPLAAAFHATSIENRELRQVPGRISTAAADDSATLPAIEAWERRYFGMGQGNLRATPLQVANAMAAIARGGLYKPPRLFLDSSLVPHPSSLVPRVNSHEINLNISPQTMAVIYDGMYAVVNESGGTAYKEFADVIARLAEQGIKVYGKTGSTQGLEVAWFAGFAKDGAGQAIAIAVVVEGGQQGSSDAAPLARDIIQFCIDEGYI